MQLYQTGPVARCSSTSIYKCTICIHQISLGIHNTLEYNCIQSQTTFFSKLLGYSIQKSLKKSHFTTFEIDVGILEYNDVLLISSMPVVTKREASFIICWVSYSCKSTEVAFLHSMLLMLRHHQSFTSSSTAAAAVTTTVVGHAFTTTQLGSCRAVGSATDPPKFS